MYVQSTYSIMFIATHDMLTTIFFIIHVFIHIDENIFAHIVVHYRWYQEHKKVSVIRENEDP